MTKELSRQLCELCGVEEYHNYEKWLELKINFDDFFCTRQSTIKNYINLYRTQHTKCKTLDDIGILIKAINGDFDDNNNIKQSIREAEWKYE